jgi:ligand-binding sensor domain-containing protein/flagellar motor protein MotB
MVRAWLYLVCFLCCFTFVQAQTKVGSFLVYGENDIPSFSNRKIFEDSRGYLWICTKNGLYKFDGHAYQPFYAFYDDNSSLTDNSITDMEEDHHGNLWIATSSAGVVKMNPFTGLMKQYARLSHDGNAIYPVNDVYRDEHNQLWFATGGRGIARYLPEKDSFENYIPDPDRIRDGTVRFQNEIWELAPDPENNDILWAAGLEGLYRFNKKTKETEKFEYLIRGRKEWKNNSYHCIYMDNLRNIWLGTWGGGLVKFDYKSGSFQHYVYYSEKYEADNLSNNIISDIFPETDSTLYISTADAGLFSFHKQHKKFDLLFPEPSGMTTSTRFSGITRSRNGSIWISGEKYILHRHPLFNRFSQSIDFRHYTERGLNVPVFQDALFDSAAKKYYVAAVRKNALLELNEDLSVAGWIPVSGLPVINTLVGLAQDEKGRLYAGAHTFPFLMYRDRNMCCLKPVAGNLWDKKSLPDIRSVHYIRYDGKKNIWVVFNTNKLLRWNLQYNNLHEFLITADSGSGLQSHRTIITGMDIDSTGDLWLSSSTGLFHFDSRNDFLHHYYVKGNSSADLASNFINAIAIDRENKIWLGPQYQGIQVFDPVSKSVIKNYSIGRGTYSNHIDDITCDKENDIWCTSSNGLLHYSRKKDSWRVFTTKDGLPGSYLVGNIRATANGIVFVDVNPEMIIFSPAELQLNTHAPLMYITGFEVSGKTIFHDTLPAYKKNISLSHRQKEVIISFTAIETLFPDKLKFFYRLIGLDTIWKATQTRSISFGNLKPGYYTFEVKAVNSDGIESNLPARIAFAIRKPFWQTSWFIILCIIAGLTLFYTVYRIRIHQFLQVQRVKNKISADLHDDIGSRLTNIQLLATLARQQAEQGQQPAAYLDQVQDEAQASAEALHEIVTDIRQPDDQMEDVGIKLRRYASEILRMSNISMSVQVDDEVSFIKMPLKKRKDLYYVFREVLHNIRRHAQAGEVIIHVAKEKQILKLNITDNGIGFDTSAQTVRNGIKIMKERIKKWQGTFAIVSSAGRGTHVEIVFPL